MGLGSIGLRVGGGQMTGRVNLFSRKVFVVSALVHLAR